MESLRVGQMATYSSYMTYAMWPRGHFLSPACGSLVSLTRRSHRSLPHPHGCVLESSWEGFLSEHHQGTQLPLLGSSDYMARGADVNIMVDAVNAIPRSDLDLSLICLRDTFYTLEGGLYVICQSNKVDDYRILQIIPQYVPP